MFTGSPISRLRFSPSISSQDRSDAVERAAERSPIAVARGAPHRIVEPSYGPAKVQRRSRRWTGAAADEVVKSRRHSYRVPEQQRGLSQPWSALEVPLVRGL